MFENVALALEKAPPLLFVGIFLIVGTFCFFSFFLSLHNVVKCIE